MVPWQVDLNGHTTARDRRSRLPSPLPAL